MGVPNLKSKKVPQRAGFEVTDQKLKKKNFFRKNYILLDIVIKKNILLVSLDYRLQMRSKTVF